MPPPLKLSGRERIMRITAPKREMHYGIVIRGHIYQFFVLGPRSRHAYALFHKYVTAHLCYIVQMCYGENAI